MPKNTVGSFSYCDHLSRALNLDFMQQTVSEIQYGLQDVEFDTIAHRGLSGALIAPVIAFLMNKQQIIVRKNCGRNAASGRWVEGYRGAKKYIIIDDLISGGTTFTETVFGVTAFTNNKAEFQRVVLYNGSTKILGLEDYICFGDKVKSLINIGQERWKNNEHKNGDYWF